MKKSSVKIGFLAALKVLISKDPTPEAKARVQKWLDKRTAKIEAKKAAKRLADLKATLAAMTPEQRAELLK